MFYISNAVHVLVKGAFFKENLFFTDVLLAWNKLNKKEVHVIIYSNNEII